jgi:uncharacterized membrane protein
MYININSIYIHDGQLKSVVISRQISSLRLLYVNKIGTSSFHRTCQVGNAWFAFNVRPLNNQAVKDLMCET